MNNAIKGIVIDPGHGGTDPGAVGNGFREKDLNLKISQYMYEQLRNLGIPVTLTRTTDETLSPSERVARVKNAYGNTPDVLVISNHINAAGTEGSNAEGAEVIYALRNSDALAKNILENIGEAGQVTRKYFQRRLPSNPSQDYYFMLRDTVNTTPVIVEYGFIDNNEDINRVNDNYKRYVDAVIDGIKETYGLGGSDNTYTVKSGDSLYKIANLFNTTPAAIRAANNLTSDVLRIGQVLRIPTTTGGTSTGRNTYTVQNGDSLWRIANRYGITINELKAANNLTNDNLRVGQVLRIPSSNGGPTYTVKNGDSLWKIANQYGITVNELKSFNGLTGDNLTIGQTLNIPEKNNSGTVPSIENSYTVKRGDTLWDIARMYNTTVDTLRELNNLSSNNLTIGQVLKVPSSESGTTRTYTVRDGDSLWKIANDYGTTVSRIRELNGLSSNTLQIGQVLRIP